jgi:hypothetical protein
MTWFTGEPKEYRECNKGGFGGKHPNYAQEEKLILLPEEEAWDFYTKCNICGKEWHEDDL